MKLATALLATALGVGGVLAVSTTTRTTPGITFSNRLLPAKDGRVVRSTVVPKSTWRGGQTWTITIAHVGGLPVESLTVRAPAMRKYQFVDSVFAPFPTCVPYRVTVVPDTVLTATGRVSTRRDSLTARLSLCRPYTVAEAAEIDSYPPRTAHIHACSNGRWVRDSGGIVIAVGDSVRLAVIDTNRYNGTWRIHGGARCPE
jgi:hypothetical protein